MYLDSDIAGADEKLNVEYYISKEKGYEGVPFIRIASPGQSNLLQIDTFVREDHKQRFPRQWLYFQMQNAEAPVSGTLLSVWQKECPEDISEAQVAELSILKFQTAEQVATASDGQLQRIGMGADGLRNLARAYLKRKREASGEAAVQETDALKKQVADLTATVSALMAAQSTPAAPKQRRQKRFAKANPAEGAAV